MHLGADKEQPRLPGDSSERRGQVLGVSGASAWPPEDTAGHEQARGLLQAFLVLERLHP